MFLVDYKPSLQRKMDREEGRQEAREEIQTQIVKNMLARGMSDEEIIALTECTREFVERLRENLDRD